MKHVIAVVGVVEHNGEILIGKKISSQGHEMNKEWHIPGGKMEEGETPEQALVREIKEETGIDVGIREMIEEVERPEKDLKVMWYLCKPLSFDINPGDDISDARFVSKSEIKDHCGHNAVSLWPPKVVEFLEKVT